VKLDPEAALVVLSGGQDSTTCLGWALARYKEVGAVSFDYGQRHVAELEAAKDVLLYFEDCYQRPIRNVVVKLGDVFAGSSPLTNPREALELYSDHGEMEKIIGSRVEKTFVPMRNAVFLTLAANRAAAAGYGTLVTGVCQEDNANYPDCRSVFIEALEDAVNRALGYDSNNQLTIQTPLMKLSKAESIKLAMDTPYTYGALAYTMSAYDGLYPPNGHDHASILRAHGFERAGVPDPLVMRAHKEGLMPLPKTDNYRTENMNKIFVTDLTREEE
jgi:7-cyano-7-deazaguanine synthase